MNRKLVAIARRLRKHQTLHEHKLWHLLRAKRFGGYKFRRQYPVGRYVVDLCCPEKKLIIELDGGQHNQDERAKGGSVRDIFLQRQGFRVLRVWNNELDENAEGVLEKVLELLK